MITPEGVDGVLFPFRYLGMQNLSAITEWQPPDFTRLQPLEIVILLAMWAGLSGRVRLPRLRLLLLLGLVHLTLHHARYEQLLGIIGALIVAEPIGALAVTARVALPLQDAPHAEAFAALDKVPPSLRQQPVLNDYYYGGVLIFAGIRPFIDSRSDMYGDAFDRRYLDIVASPVPDALEAALVEHRVAWTFFRADNPVVRQLDREPGWRRLYADQSVVIHVRSDAPADMR